MKQYASEHYVFHYGEGTPAERDIEKIAAEQEACYSYICNVLGAAPAFQIQYYLCDSPEEVGRIYGDNAPCNGFAAPPDRIYAVYNDKIQCIGFHEDAHIISYTINRPDCPAIREGLAMYFDRKWWGIQNLDWSGFFLQRHQYVGIADLLQKECFFDTDCAISYPIMGAFTDYLIAAYGSSRFIQLYRCQDIPQALQTVYGKTPEELDDAFTGYVRLFSIDPALQERMAELLKAYFEG